MRVVALAVGVLATLIRKAGAVHVVAMPQRGDGTLLQHNNVCTRKPADKQYVQAPPSRGRVKDRYHASQQ